MKEFEITYRVISTTGDQLTKGSVRVKGNITEQKAIEFCAARYKKSHIDFGRFKTDSIREIQRTPLEELRDLLGMFD